MIGMKIKDAKKNFFDKKAVIAAVGKAKAGALAKDGGLVMTIARRLMRPFPKSKQKQMHDLVHLAEHTHDPVKKAQFYAEAQKIQQATSPAGKPPRTILKLIRNLLVFAYDFSTRSAVIGPAKLSAPKASDNALRNLEEGGVETITSRRGKARTEKISPHPYMGPALAEATPKLAAVWADSVK